jgi:uncharacterized protein YbaP (TraB family)
VRLLRIAAAFLLFASLASPAAADRKKEDAPPPAPALWRISDADSAVYIFGAIGLSAQDATWRSRSVARAIDASETIWFEAAVDDPSAQASANKIFQGEGKLAPGAKLSSLLAPDTRASLAAVAQEAGLPIETLEPLRPWSAFVVLSSRIEPEGSGESVDAAILREARGRGRELRYFDTVEETLRALTSMPQKLQVALVSQLVADFARQRADAREGFEAWRTGDIDGADAYLNRPLREAAPDIYSRLVSDRAVSLAGEIGGILATPQTAFISLNASYLVGAGSIPERLAEAGFKVERVTD